MTIEYVRDVQPLADEGYTDDQIADHLAAKTARALQCSDLRVLLLETQAIVIDAITGGKSGPLIDHYSTLTGEQQHLLGWFIAHVFNGGENVSTDEYPRSVQLSSVLATLPVELQSVGNAVVELGGGKPHESTVTADVVTARQVYDDAVAAEQAAEQAQQAVLQQQAKLADKIDQYIGPLLTSLDSDDNNWINAIQNIANTWSE